MTILMFPFIFIFKYILSNIKMITTGELHIIYYVFCLK